ncbi:hypothetical protein EV363DRAFT_393040 [Boletus edulis]|nr:hypothetical protein EV363DRAFT_393040 [Boletus edulis]
MTNAPPMPPLLIVTASGISAFDESRSGVRLGRMVYGPHASRVLGGGLGETVELPPIPTPSLPPQLVRTLFASHAIDVRGLPAYTPFLSAARYWGGDPLGDVFHRIICITGFVPIPPPLTSTSTRALKTAPESVSDRAASADLEGLKDGHDAEEDADLRTEEEDEENDHRELGGQSRRRTPKPFPTPSQQFADARILARRRVYDMQYLRDDRLWGPYQVVTRVPIKAPLGMSRPGDGNKGKSQEGGKGASASSAASGRGWIHRIGTLAWSMGAEIEPDEFDSDPTSDDSEDEDWHDPADHGQTSFAPFGSGDRDPEQTIGTKDMVDAEIEMDTEPTEPEHPLISLILASAVTADVEPTSDPTPTSSRRRTRRSNPRSQPNYSVSPREIKPHHLRPDYAFLASARIVVEANLKELFGKEISDDVPQPASEVRAGGVGMFWEDEDEILRTRAGSSELASSLSLGSSSTATAPSGISAACSNPSALELADILSQFQNLEVARLGSTCGYWSGWIEGQQTAKRGIDEGADVAPSLLEGDVGARKTRIVKQLHQLEKPIGVTSTTEYKGKGKGNDSKKSASVPALGAGDWRFGSEGEACEGWDWAGVAGIWNVHSTVCAASRAGLMP